MILCVSSICFQVWFHSSLCIPPCLRILFKRSTPISMLKSTSVSSISSAATRKDSISSAFVFSCAFTPGRSISQPIHNSPDFFYNCSIFHTITLQRVYPDPYKFSLLIHQQFYYVSEPLFSISLFDTVPATFPQQKSVIFFDMPCFL